MIKNDYTGSLGTDSQNGCFNREIFCYKVYVIGEVSDPSLKAECYTQLASMDGVKIYDQQEMTVEPSTEGLNEINEWLDERYLGFKERIK